MNLVPTKKKEIEKFNGLIVNKVYIISDCCCLNWDSDRVIYFVLSKKALLKFKRN